MFVGFQNWRVYGDLNMKPCFNYGRFSHSSKKCNNDTICIRCGGKERGGVQRNYSSNSQIVCLQITNMMLKKMFVISLQKKDNIHYMKASNRKISNLKNIARHFYTLFRNIGPELASKISSS